MAVSRIIEKVAEFNREETGHSMFAAFQMDLPLAAWFWLLLGGSMLLVALLGGCAGRSPAPVPIVQVADQYSTCAGLTAEIAANNQAISALASEHGWKVAQNVVAGVAGLFIPILWFGLDFQGAASTEQTALEGRQQYLASLALQRCTVAGR